LIPQKADFVAGDFSCGKLLGGLWLDQQRDRSRTGAYGSGMKRRGSSGLQTKSAARTGASWFILFSITYT